MSAERNLASRARNALGQTLLDGQPVSGEVEVFLAAEDARLRELAEKAVAQNTRRAYSSDWESFVGWAFSRKFVPLPATPDTVARYLRWLVDRPRAEIEEEYRRNDGRVVKRKRRQRGVATSTVGRHLISIAKAHQTAGFEDPVATVYVQTIWRGLRRERGMKKTPKEALKRDLLLDVLPAPPAEDQPKAKRLAAVRNRAIMLLAFSGAFRRSEVASLNVDDLEYDDVGVAVTLTRSKTNQEGLLETVLIPFAENVDLDAARAIATWIDLAGIAEGPLFRALDRHGNIRGRIQPALVATLVKELIDVFAAANPGLKLESKHFAAHSLRSGWITTAAREGRSERDMMQHSRHKSIPIFRGYVQRATRWDGHPGLGLL
jgi:integrase